MSAPAPQVLIIDDDESLSHAMADVLGSEGFAVLQTATLEEGLEKLRQTDVAAVLCDYSLVRGHPHPWQELARLKTAAQPAAFGVCSGWTLSEAEVLGHGLDFLLAKPFDIEKLLAVISAHAHGEPPSPELRRTIDAYFAALAARDWPAVGALCTEDVRYHLPGDAQPFAAEVRGREAFKAYSAKTFADFPEAAFAVKAVFTLPSGAVVARYDGSWRLPSGEQARLPGSVVFRLRDRLLAEIGVRLELRAFLGRAAGPPG